MVEARLRPKLAERPAMLVVQGDTSSAFGAALAGFAAGIPVAHVEAGLRTHDPSLPWPEEEFRTAIDSRSALLFAPSEHSASNLRRERLPGRIHITGNTGIDALFAVLSGLGSAVRSDYGTFRILVTCHRRESWGEGLRRVAQAIASIARRDRTAIEFVLHPNPAVAMPIRDLLGNDDNVAIIPPEDHRPLIDRMRRCDLILSDSGGIQEEAPAIGIPLLILRDKTERPEAIATGNAMLVGTDPDRIVAAVLDLMEDRPALAAMARPAFPFGDGRSAPRIARLIADWIDQRGRKVG